MRDTDGRTVTDPAGATLRVAGVSEGRIVDLKRRLGGTLTTARAMTLAATYERLVQGRFAPAEADALLAGMASADVSAPRDHADALASLIQRLTELGVSRADTLRLATSVAAEKTQDVAALAEDVPSIVRGWLAAGIPLATVGHLVAQLCADGAGAVKARAESVLASFRAPGADCASQLEQSEHRMTKGGTKMGDPDKRNGPEVFARTEKERERLEREREALEQEREKIDGREKVEREREKLDRVQEQIEARLELQEERLEQLEEELEAREEALDEAAEELDGIEVEGVEGIREMLDVMSDRLPHLMRGIHDTIYSPDRVQTTAEAFASFYKTLVKSGMPDYLAADMTRQHFATLQSEMQAQMGSRKSPRRGHGPRGPECDPCPECDPLGPNFDPLGPNFDPFGGRRRGRPAAPAEPAEPAAPAEPCDPCTD